MLSTERKATVAVRVGGVTIGGGHPIAVQSMTNTDTADAATTAKQVAELHAAGSELVRITVNNAAAAAAVPEIHARLQEREVEVPLIGDFHYNGHRLLRDHPDCARLLDKYRINPGNVGKGARHDENFSTLIEIAKEHDKPVRIGVNAGSLDQELLDRLMDENAGTAEPKDAAEVMLEAIVQSAMQSAHAAEELGLPRERIILSAKISQVQELVQVYRMLAARTDHALHLGLTEAGMGAKGIVASTAAIAVLLQPYVANASRRRCAAAIASPSVVARGP